MPTRKTRSQLLVIPSEPKHRKATRNQRAAICRGMRNRSLRSHQRRVGRGGLRFLAQHSE